MTTTRLAAYARTHGLTIRAATAQLVTIALDHLEARTAGGTARHAGRSPAERSASASVAATARWAKEKTS